MQNLVWSGEEENKKQTLANDGTWYRSCSLTSIKEILYLYSFTTVGVFEHSYCDWRYCWVVKLYMCTSGRWVTNRQTINSIDLHLISFFISFLIRWSPIAFSQVSGIKESLLARFYRRLVPSREQSGEQPPLLTQYQFEVDESIY